MRLVTIIKVNPRLFTDRSLAASAAEAELALYSPPTPTPVNPRAIVRNQKKPMRELPVPFPVECAAHTRMIPATIKTVDNTIPA